MKKYYKIRSSWRTSTALSLTDKDFPYRVTLKDKLYVSNIVLNQKILNFLYNNIGNPIKIPTQFQDYLVRHYSNLRGYWMVKCHSKKSARFYFQKPEDAISFKLFTSVKENILD